MDLVVGLVLTVGWPMLSQSFTYLHLHAHVDVDSGLNYIKTT